MSIFESAGSEEAMAITSTFENGLAADDSGGQHRLGADNLLIGPGGQALTGWQLNCQRGQEAPNRTSPPFPPPPPPFAAGEVVADDESQPMPDVAVGQVGPSGAFATVGQAFGRDSEAPRVKSDSEDEDVDVVSWSTDETSDIDCPDLDYQDNEQPKNSLSEGIASLVVANGIHGNAMPYTGVTDNDVPNNGIPSNVMPNNGIHGNAVPNNVTNGNGMPNNGIHGNEVPNNAFIGRGMPNNGIHGNAIPNNGIFSNGMPNNGSPSNITPSNGIHGVLSNNSSHDNDATNDARNGCLGLEVSNGVGEDNVPMLGDTVMIPYGQVRIPSSSS